MRRLFLLLFLLVAILTAGVLAWWNRATLVEMARQDLQRQLEQALGQPAAVGTLTVSLLPPRVRAEGIVIGGDNPLATLEYVDVRLALLSTIAEARPVAKIAAGAVFVDVTHLPKSKESEEPGLAISAFRLGGIKIDGLRLRFPMGDEVALLSVAELRGLVESARLRDLVSVTVGLRDAQLQRANQTLDLGEIRASGIRDADGITIQSASLTAPGRTIELTGATPTRHVLKAELDLHDLVIIDDDFEPFSGPGRVSGELQGPLERPVAEGSIEIADVRIAGRPLGVLTTHVHHEGETTRFENAHLRGDAGDVRGTIVAKFRREIPVEGTLTWNVKNLEALLRKLDLKLSFENQVEATTIVKGQFDPLQLDVAAEGNVLAGVEVASARANGRISEDGSEFQFSLAQPTGTRISAQVSARDGVLDGQADVETFDLSAVSLIIPRPVATLDLSGEGTGSVAIGGTTSAPRFEGTVTAGPLSVAGVYLDRLEGSFVWTEAVLAVPAATLATRGGSAVLQGKVALTEDEANDWQLDLTSVDTDLATGIARRFTRFPDLVEGGHLTGVVACVGRWSEPNLRASLVAEAPRVAGEDFARLAIVGERSPGSWSFQLDATHTSDLRFRVDGGAAGDTPAQIEVSATPVDLNDVQLARKFGVTGVLNLEGHLAGDLDQANGEFELSASNLAIGRERIGEVELRAVGEKGQWRLQGQAPAKRLSISATALAQAPFPYTARVGWEELAFDYEATETDHLNGSTTGSADFSGVLESPDGSDIAIRVSELSLQWGDALVGLDAPIVIKGKIGRLQIEPFSVVGKETALRIAGSLADQTELAMTLEGRASLDYLELLGEPLVSTDGTVVLDMQLHHSARRGWAVDGTATLERSVLDLGLPVAFTDSSGTFVAHGRVVEVDQFEATSGGGRVRVSGLVDLDHGPALEWRLDDVALNPEPGIEAVVAGNGALNGTWRELLLRGEIDVKSALYTRDFEIVDIPALFAPRIEAVSPAPSPTVVRLDLETTGRGGLYIDNNVAQVELSLDGALKGTLEAPKVIGTVSIVGGSVKVRRRTFTLIGGAADFRGKVPPNPNLNINAETEISTKEADYVVTATVTGTARDPVVTFGSDDPTLTQNDLVSLVAVGRTAAELQGESGGVSSFDALALVPTSPVEEQVSQLVGIDRFEIDLAQTDSQGDLSPGITIGKNLTDRFRAALTTTFNVDARNAVVLEYDLTRRIVLIGQWEADSESDAGAFGGGVRMRYEFRRIPLSLLGGTAEGHERDGE